MSDDIIILPAKHIRRRIKLRRENADALVGHVTEWRDHMQLLCEESARTGNGHALANAMGAVRAYENVLSLLKTLGVAE